jgi:hypothetical protein
MTNNESYTFSYFKEKEKIICVKIICVTRQKDKVINKRKKPRLSTHILAILNAKRK